MTAVPDFSLKERNALVTGGSRGIGRAIAECYAKAGARVWLAARTEAEIETVAGSLRAEGHAVEAMAVDVTDVEGFRARVSSLPRIDVFVNNAGGNRPGPFVDVTEEDFDAVSGLNLRAAFFALQSIARHMIAHGGRGSIINMSSQMGHVGAKNRSVYCATKWAIEGLTKVAAIELAPYGIRVNTICPTFIETPMTRSFLADTGFRADCLGMIKLGRLGDVDDVIGAALYLACGASALMTGSHLILDGGWTAE